MLFDPNRGRLTPPNLGDRTWSDLVGDMVALIPQYAPQWTNQGPADVGMTLVEMFAWLVEGLTYRLNQVPDKNYLAFLNLLGITRVPPEPARSFLTFAAAGGAPVVVPKGTQAQTTATETQAPVVFETDADLTVLPVNLEAAVLINKSGTSTYANVSGYYTSHPAPGATITVAPSQAVQLCLGFDNPTAAAVNLLVRLFQPLPSQTPSEATVAWLYSTAGMAPSGWPALTVPGSADGTAGLTQDGQVQLTVPATWASQAPAGWGVPAASAADVVTSAYYGNRRDGAERCPRTAWPPRATSRRSRERSHPRERAGRGRRARSPSPPIPISSWGTPRQSRPPAARSCSAEGEPTSSP
jgi:predicted phage baseplate assembly protein